MANDLAHGSLVLSGIGVGLPQEAEYDAVYAAVTATERGRWFLSEFANRNRQADTGTLVAALARLEAAIGAAGLVNSPNIWPESAATAEKISDLAFALRDRGADPALCDALDATAREIGVSSGNGADDPERVRSAASAYADETMAADKNAAAVTEPTGDDPEENVSSPADGFEFELQDRKKFAAAAAALAASLNALGDQTADAPLPQALAERQSSAAVIPAHDYSGVIERPPQPEPVAPNPRWHIEGPDFVFHQARPSNGPPVASSNEGRKLHSLLPRPELLPNPEEDPAELFEPTAKIALMADPGAAAALAGPEPAAALAQPPPAVAEIAPAANPAAVTVRAVARPAPVNPLAALQALTEDELLALFG